MKETNMLIKGGTLVTAYGMREADVWIEEGKIAHIAKEILDPGKHRSAYDLDRIFDASGYLVLPGFIWAGNTNFSRLSPVSSFLREVRGVIERGYTSMLDTIRLEDWMRAEHIHYQMTPHFNNLIDYAIQISLEARHFTPRILRMLGRQGIRLIQLVVRDGNEMNSFQWDILYSIIHHYQLSLQLHIPADMGISADLRRRMIEGWLQDCQYGKIRTRVEHPHPSMLTQNKTFYHLAMLTEDQCEKWFYYFLDHWYGSYPAFAALEQIVIRQKEWRKKPFEFLSLLVRLSSTNFAKALGTYPRKGCLQAGADADLLFIEKSAWLTNFDLSTILKCSEICFPTYIMSKGRWIYRDGVHSPLVGTGNYLQDLTPYSYVI